MSTRGCIWSSPDGPEELWVHEDFARPGVLDVELKTGGDIVTLDVVEVSALFLSLGRWLSDKKRVACTNTLNLEEEVNDNLTAVADAIMEGRKK